MGEGPFLLDPRLGHDHACDKYQSGKQYEQAGFFHGFSFNRMI
jgi:hypothetical protein